MLSTHTHDPCEACIQLQKANSDWEQHAAGLQQQHAQLSQSISIFLFLHLTL